MTKQQLQGNLLLLSAAFVWGLGYVAQKLGAEQIETFTYNMITCFLAGLVLLPFALFSKAEVEDRKELIKGGIFCGLATFCGLAFQQAGLIWTTAGKTSFITTLYIFIVPLILRLRGHKVSMRMWCCIATALVGLYFLSGINGDFGNINIGDIVEIGAACGFAFQMLVVDKYARYGAVKLACIQYFVATLLSGIVMQFTGEIDVQVIRGCILPILYSGIISNAAGFLFQLYGIVRTSPTLASMILSSESIFGVALGIALLNETLTSTEILGCVIMLCSLTVAQLPEKKGKVPASVKEE